MGKDKKQHKKKHGYKKGYNVDPVPLETKKEVKKRQKYHCACCGEKHEYFILEVHHIKRRRMGGSNALSNLVAVCANCHRRIHHYDKHGMKTPFDYGESLA